MTTGLRITALDVYDVRFPTSRDLDGSDATNVNPDYSAAYAVLRTDGADGADGYGFVFTTGIGNDVQCAAIAALRPWVVGRPVVDVCDRLGPFARELVHNPHLRWLGPEKGVMHMAIGAVINAAWDLAAKRAGLPVWLLLAELDTDQVIDLIDFSWLTDALTPDDVRETLDRTASDRQERVETLQRQGFPAYTTTPGWLGYTDDKLDRLCREAVADGFDLVKLKVGADVEDDLRRLEIARAAVGSDVRIAVDANQHWAVDEAIAWMRRLAPTAPYWIEEPTHPDDILGHARIRQAIAPIRVATGEHVANRVMVKQLLQAGAIDILQIDATRVGGINENLAHLFLAAKFGVPVCPHAGGVGLCEVVQHLAMYDAVAVAGGVEGRVLEFVDHLHEHFVTPVVLRDASYVPPSAPGLGSQMLAASMAEFAFPDGPVWASASESSQRRNS